MTTQKEMLSELLEGQKGLTEAILKLAGSRETHSEPSEPSDERPARAPARRKTQRSKARQSSRTTRVRASQPVESVLFFKGRREGGVQVTLVDKDSRPCAKPDQSSENYTFFREAFLNADMRSARPSDGLPFRFYGRISVIEEEGGELWELLEAQLNEGELPTEDDIRDLYDYTL